MIYLAYFIICSPILAVIFFIFYKLVLLIKEKRQNNLNYQKPRIPLDYDKPAVKSKAQVIFNEEEASEEEIQAVISAAVAVYLTKV